MISLFKLSSLPRSQKLRKAANLIRAGERRLFALTNVELDYFARLIDLLLDDGKFPEIASGALKDFRDLLVKISSGSCGTGYNLEEGLALRRGFNTVYQLILLETGKFQADWDFYEPDGKLDPAMRQSFPGMQIYLEDIRSPYNVGSMFRAAESFGAAKIWLSPFSASPKHKRAERTAMGCVDILPWEQLSFNPFDGHDNLGAGKPPGLAGPFFALETGGIALKDFQFPKEGVLIAGSEELGVSPEALSVCDSSLGRVSIPSYGAKGSLNVSVAFGIVMQAWAAEYCHS